MGFSSDRERREYEAWKKQDDAEQARLKERLEAPIKLAKIKADFEQTANRQATFHRRVALGLVENAWIDPSKPFIDPNDHVSLEAFNRASAIDFANEYLNQGWYPSEHNKQVLLDFLTNRGIYQISAREFAAAFKAIKREPGIFEDKPAPAPRPVPVAQAPIEQEPDWDALPRLPIDHKSPIAYKRDEHEQTFSGTDPNTGKPVKLTAREVDLLSADEYKAIFHVPNVQLGKYSFNGGR
jgi:hypothetical protein